MGLNYRGARDWPQEFKNDLATVSNITEESANRNLFELIIGMLDPAGIIKGSRGAIAPPNADYVATQLKSVTVYQNLSIGDNAPSGAVIWLPCCGIRELHRYVMVNSGTAVPEKVSATTNRGTIGLMGIECIMLYNTFIPVIPAVDIQLTPDLSPDFVYGRLIGGILSVQSATTSTSTVALSGTLAAGALSDTRSSPDFSPPWLKQSSRPGEGILDVQIQTGIVTILASDVSPEIYMPLDINSTVSWYNSAYVPDILDGRILSALYSTAASPYKSGTNYAAAWVSSVSKMIQPVTANATWGPSYKVEPPINVQLASQALPDDQSFEVWATIDVTATATASGVAYDMPAGAVGPSWAPIFVFSYYIQADDTGTAQQSTTSTVSYVITCVSQRIEVFNSSGNQYFAGASTAGFPVYAAPHGMGAPFAVSTATSLPNASLVNVGASVPIAVADNSVVLYQVPQVFTVNPKRPAGSMWLGTAFICSGCTGDQTGGPGGAGNITADTTGSGALVLATTGLFAAYATIQKINFFARRIYNQGFAGPARIIRWDNPATGQNVLIKGTLCVEAVPGGAIAPFFKSQPGGSSGSLALLGLAAVMFNSSSGTFKRNYTGDEYRVLQELIAKGQLTINTMLSTVEAAGEMRLLEANGFFDFLKKAARVATPYLKQAVTDYGPMLLDRGISMMNADGDYSMMNSENYQRQQEQKRPRLENRRR